MKIETLINKGFEGCNIIDKEISKLASAKKN